MSQAAIERRFPARFEELSRVMADVSAFLETSGVDGHADYVTALAIEELVTNTIKYGYDDRLAHEILVRVELQPGMVRLLIEDDGHAFNPLEAPEPDLDQPPEQRALGGLGIHLIRKLAQSMEYERRGDHNRVRVQVQYHHSETDAQSGRKSPQT